MIVNADDFGLSAGVNRAVLEAHGRGVLTSTTVLATAAHAGGAMDASRDHPDLDFGVHVNFGLGRPASDPSQIPSLVDSEGRFRSEGDLLRRLARGGVDRREVYREVTAQVQLVRSLGVEPTHWDAHRAVAFWPGLCGPSARAAAEAGLRRARTPRVWVVEPGRSPRAARMRWRARRGRRVLTEANRFVGRRTLERRFALPDWRVAPNLVESGADYLTRWQQALLNAPPGTCEVVSHPGHVDDELRRLTPGLTDDRLIDLRALTDATLPPRLEAAGIALIGFRHLR